MKSGIFRIVVSIGFLSFFAAGPAVAGMNGGGPGGGMGAGDDRGMSELSSGSQQKAPGMMSVSDMSAVSIGGMDSGGVKLELKPVSLKKGQLKIKFTANTHTGSLTAYDLMQQAMLIYDGNETGPVKVDRMRGHHAGGTMIFDVEGNPEHFKIVIKGIPDVEERLYEW